MKLGQTSLVHFLSRIGFSLVGFVTTVFLARELGAEVLGTYLLTISLLHWFVVFGDFGITGALRKRLSESESQPGLLTAGLVSQVGLLSLICFLIVAIANQINTYVGAEVALWLVALLGAKLSLAFVSVVLDGQHKVHVSSLLAPLDKTAQSAVQVVLVIFGVGLLGLFIGYIVGSIVAVLVGVYFARIGISFPSRDDFRSLYDFARYSWLGTIKGRAFLSMDTIILGYFVVSNDIVGIYEIAWNVSALFAIFSGSLNRAVFPEISSLSNEQVDRIRDIVSATVAYAGLFLIPGLVGSVLVGDVVLKIYGEAFVQGQLILVVLVLSQLVYAYEEQFITALGAMDHPDVIFRTNAVFLGTNFFGNILLVPYIGWLGAAIGTTISAAVGLVLSYRGLSRRLEFSFPWTEIARQVVASVVMGGVVYSGRVLFGDALLVIMSLIFVGSGVYIIILMMISGQFRTTVLQNFPV